MANENDRFVVKHPDGWAVKKAGAERASAVTRTQAEAQEIARRIVGNAGGGEVTTQGMDGRFRDKDTVAPGNDPCPPRDEQ